jgi:heme A synthase
MRPSLVRFAWFVLAYNVAVILWGAYVRATGSGAGCGAHWPLCNGEVVPRAREAATLIEFSHRFSSGLALIAIAVLVVWIFRACAPGHPARLGAVLSADLIVTEAAVGAFSWSRTTRRWPGRCSSPSICSTRSCCSAR